MLVAKSPLRISFLGGGTDFPSHFENSSIGGSVLGISINRYVYVMIEHQPPFEEVKFRVTYRMTDAAHDLESIKHPSVRESLKLRSWNAPLNIATMADLPGRSGLGSSSAFTVALNLVLDKMQNRHLKLSDDYLYKLAQLSIEIERFRLKEHGGYQDQFHSAFGGFRRYDFFRDTVEISPKIVDSEFQNLLSDNLYLVANTAVRNSADYAQGTDSRIRSGSLQNQLENLTLLTRNTYDALTDKSKTSIDKFRILCQAVAEGWALKILTGIKIDQTVSNMIEKGKASGACAWKLCGAGGTGFIAFLVEEEYQSKFESSFSPTILFKPGITSGGVTLNEI